MIYVNVTNTRTTGSKTGIQRVVNELSRRLSGQQDFRLLCYEGEQFYLVDDGDIVTYGSSRRKHSGVIFNYEDILLGDLFLDPDASWGDPYDIGDCYKTFKRHGAIIVKFHHDAVPILYPEFADETTAFRYADNFIQSATYADYWVCVSETVENDLKEIFKSLDLSPPQTFVAALGADISTEGLRENSIGKECESLLSKDYILSVGTIEPRKNYEFVIETFERFASSNIESSISLVLVGKSGWNNKAVIERILSHELYGERIFWLNSTNDAELDALYRKAKVCLCLSHYEGYGLPAIEALARGSQVICTAGSSLEEVSRGFAHVVELDLDQATNKLKEVLSGNFNFDTSGFTPPTWDMAATRLVEILKIISCDSNKNTPPAQAVYISIRPLDLRKSILSVLDNMAFIRKFLILTSDEMLNEIKAHLENIDADITVLSEGEIGILKPPQDHLQRNTQLRMALYARDEVDDNFIAFDDDYSAVTTIDASNFYSNGQHKIYYYYDSSSEWLGALPNPTSFDKGIWRTREYLERCGFDTKLYNSHQPQIINKEIANYTLKISQVENLDEWSSYFNIAKHIKPQMFIDRIYQTAGWPSNLESWLPSQIPDEILFYNDMERGGPIDLVKKNQLLLSEMVKAQKAQAYIKYFDPTLIFKNGQLFFNRRSIRCLSNSTIYMPIYDDGLIYSMKMIFLDKEVQYEGQKMPNFIHIPLSHNQTNRFFTLRVECKVEECEHVMSSEIDVHIDHV